MEAGADRKFVLRMTCLKNGGFRKYQSLPPQEVFKHAYWVLATEMEVKIKQKQTFFTRRTDWMRLPVYLAVNKGLLFVYTTQDSGYALRVSAAQKLNFEAVKQKQKKAAAKSKKNHELLQQKEEEYSAQISLQFQFGEIEMKFENAEVCRSWRAILLVAHESPKDLAKVGQDVAKQFLLKKSPSLESIVSAKSVFPEDGDKDKSERVEVHRHPIVESPPDEEGAAQSEVKSSASSSSVASSIVQYPATPPPFFVGDYEIPSTSTAVEEMVPVDHSFGVKESGSNSSLWDEEGSDGEDFEESKTQTVDSNNNYNIFEESLLGTSEVDVTLRDVEHPITWKKNATAPEEAVDLALEEDGTANSHTTACKTSPSQLSRQNSIASIASRKSMFYEDFRKAQEEERPLPGLYHRQMNAAPAVVVAEEDVETAVLPSPSLEAQKVAAIQSNEFVAGIFKDDPLRKSIFVKVQAVPVQQIQKIKLEPRQQPLQQQQHLRPFSMAPPPTTRVAARVSTLPIPEHTPSKEIVKRLERMTAAAAEPKRVSFASVQQPKVPARLSNLEYWRVKELQGGGSQKPVGAAFWQPAAATEETNNKTSSSNVRQLSRKLQQGDESHI